MNTPEKEALEAMGRLVKWAQARELPPGEWAVPLQDVIDGEETPEYFKLFPFPLVCYGKGGVVEYGNIRFQDETDLTTEDIRSGKVKMQNIRSFDFEEAMKLALRGETHVVNDFEKNPLECFTSVLPEDVTEYKTAVFYSIFSDVDPTRGVILFLPFEWRPENV